MTIWLPGLLAAAVGATPAAAGPLDGFRWNKRLLLVFAPTGDAAAVAQQRLLAVDPAGLAERDLLVVEVPPHGSVDLGSTGAIDAVELRDAYGVAEREPFTALLVGKDGGVKRRFHEPVVSRDLFATVDAMPMRAIERRK